MRYINNWTKAMEMTIIIGIVIVNAEFQQLNYTMGLF